MSRRHWPRRGIFEPFGAWIPAPGSVFFMATIRWIGWGAFLWAPTFTVVAQHPVPLADRIDAPLLPSGISALPVQLNARLVYLFQDEEGTEVLHFIGDFTLTTGLGEYEALTSREAVIWLTNRETEDRSYRQLQVLLWNDARIEETGGTTTTGPALFTTLNTTGEVIVEADDVAIRSSTDSPAFREGNRIRRAMRARTSREEPEAVSMGVVDASGLARPEEPARHRPILHFQSGGDFKLTEADDRRQLLSATGRIYLSRGLPETGDYLEIQADSAVVFLPARSPALEPESSQDASPAGSEAGAADRTTSERRLNHRAEYSSDRQMMASPFGELEIEGAYVEGDILMAQGPTRIRASRIYYDFLQERAIILDAVVRTTIANRNLPLYLRAAEVRQLSQQSFIASDAVFTTSEFHTPHYHIGAKRIELTDLTPADLTDGPGGLKTGRFQISHATLNLNNTPIAYWPFVRGNLDTSETSIRGLRTGFSDRFGMELGTDWHLFNVLGLETPTGFDATLRLEYFTERGPAAGIEADYTRQHYTGLLRSYVLTDNDTDFLGRDRERPSQKDIRGRFLLRHRQYLRNDWQLSLEFSYLSDRGFLEEFFEGEFDNDKDQETLLYLKNQRNNRAFTALLQTRLMDFLTQTERLPDFSYHLAGESIGGGATLHSENRIGVVRYRPANRTFRELLREGRMMGTGSVARVDSRQEIGLPVDLGPWRFVPFASLRGTAWDDSPHDGGIARAFGTLGVRGSIYLSRLYPKTRSTLFDLDGVRHIIKSDVVAFLSGTNHETRDLFPFDETVERIDDVDGVTLGVRQRWQTKRGGESRRRSVDFLTLDLDIGLFNDANREETTNGFTSFGRPENSISQNYTNASLVWRMNDRTALLSELNYDVNDGEADILNISFSVERSPRFSYLVGYRLIEESDSNLLSFDFNYRMSEKHTLALREAFDLERGRTLDLTLGLVRKFPRWFGAVSFALDEAEDDFGVSVSVWPEGLPQAALGSRRFTGLGRNTRVRSD